ncbi:non-ribosomal peptide synthetase [Longimicrobium terrae]|uniref:Amino acid adenylation domain-containing protein n=1 Tax=Longimicrobium terrae TaxID=1639882 RepID=A0A841GPZ9_9BACT|nr:non-ribosomal peptide synthetase [Longimicrobium terrae]MBB4634030.1 amino acid adenylation domain-containing protein [Longimicrobium terrae]MBB6069080.1 amino acid adenylation domain-containing protein [Longimicrobium terrae]NNC28255.1 amino acid adenylation domain-containing protein [Longimicrobium terrae]
MNGPVDTAAVRLAPGTGVVGNPEPVELSGAERRRVLKEWNRTDAPFPAGTCMHELFEQQVLRTPDAQAAVCGTRSLTYAGLNERANRLAHHLRGMGVGPEVRVAVGFARGLDMLVSLMAVLKAGGAYVPLDLAYPADRLEFILRDARAAVLLTHEASRALLPVPDGLRVLSVDLAADDIARERADNPQSGVAARNLGYLIYTSGSTGVPKGVAIEHESAVVLLAWASALHTAEELGGMLASTSICFDLSIYELFLPLSLGGRCIIVENALALPTCAAADQVRLINSVPSAAATLLKTGGIPAGVTTVNLAGEPLRTEIVDALYARGVQRVYDLYGPSEDTTYSTFTLRRAGAPATIGRPISNTRAYVVDEALRPVAVGSIGELYLAGLGLARGYLGRPGLTADRFIPDPFSAGPGGRMYRTGDRVKWTEDGELEYLGRLDHQVKIRGFRVELGEIESAMRRFAGVRDCVVVAREDEPGDKRLVGYLTGAADVDALREQLRRTLPAHFVPSAFVALDEMPLTPNGKLDRKALPAPAMTSAEAYVAPRTPVEEVLAGAWAEVLGVARVGVDDNVFDLGAHSLLATRVVARVAEVFGVEMTVRAVFEAPTVALLAGRVDAARRADAPRLPALVPVERSVSPPLSFAQEGLWFLDRVQQAPASYNVPVEMRISGPLNVPVLARALGEIIRRHEVLRTVFQDRAGEPVQVINPFIGFHLPVEDLSALDGEERRAAASRRAAEEAAVPFDLAAGPLVRGRVLRLADDEHVLLLSLHHAVTDGWSMDVLYRELGDLYAAYLDGRESPLAEPALQYADYAAWERACLRGEVMDAELAWWKARLEGAPALLELPTDHPRATARGFGGARETVDFPPELAERLEALGRATGGSLYMVLMGAFQVLLGRYAGSDDVVVGSPIAGRTRRELQEMIGFFTSTLVLRTDLGGDPAFREVLRRVRDVTLSAYEHQQTPFEAVVRALHPGRSLSHSPVFQVMMVLQTGGPGPLLPGMTATVRENHPQSAKLDLTLSFIRGADGLRADLEYRTDLFERGTVQRMLRHLHNLLDQVSANADVRIGELALLDDAERAVVVDEWNRTDAPYPADACIHTLFEAQVARTPHALAATDGTQSVTYAELDARANRLARHLVALGVGAETRVAIGLARGVEMLVAMIAVLKAGGAYVPLDPAYPADRLAFTLRDARVAVMLTQESLRGSLPVENGVRVVSVDEPASAAAIAAESADGLGKRADARSLAYLIYTSGSTGVPKGVAIEHENAVALLTWAADLHTAEELGGMLACTSICFDLSVYELFLPLSLGGRVIIVENALALPSSPAVADVRLLNTVPSAASALLASGGIPAGVTTVNLAGEPLRTELVDALYAHGIQRVYDLYGPSEDTTYSTWTHRLAGAAPTIGRPISNTRAYVLDAGQRPVPVGVAGELFLAGRGLARGYLGRAALTAERFIPDPFTTAPGERMYRTGDRVRWTSTGNLEYLGRVDAQVKVRGYRIELGEIETALRRHDAVRDCVVVAREDVPGEKRLAAYVAGEVEAEALRAHLRQSLPEYMVPAAFVILHALPLTPNGKLDRKALPAPEFAAESAGYTAPRTPVEAELAGIWAEVLGVERVGVTDDFFALGGHSLLATRLVWRIRESMEGELDVVTLFNAPTIEAIAPGLSPRRSRRAVDAPVRRAGSSRLLEMLDDMGDDELDRLLEAHPDLQPLR